jgi:ABC-type oligopeptide transport system substrate-binding subunit
MMKNIAFSIIILTATSFFIYSCSSSDKQKETIEEELSRGISQHFPEKNYNKKTDAFTSSIGTTNDIVEFTATGDLYLRLSKDNQVFDITQKQQQHRLRGLKNLMLGSK